MLLRTSINQNSNFMHFIIIADLISEKNIDESAYTRENNKLILSF